MARKPRKARPLVVGSDTFMWSLRHAHQVLEGPRYRDCTEQLAIRRTGARGRLVIVFREGPGRQVPDGYFVPSEAVSAGGQIWLNLHEPGTVRELLDEALVTGWQPDQPAVERVDGWVLFDRVAARRSAQHQAGSADAGANNDPG